jgi:uncharacterized membrane protein
MIGWNRGQFIIDETTIFLYTLVVTTIYHVRGLKGESRKMLETNKEISSYKLAVTAVFTALVAVATIIFSIYVPATRGYFNVGESMVFLSALLFGPFIGAFAGGVGSMIADLYLGYPLYAPATLVIKACEGAIVGFLNDRNPGINSTKEWRQLTIVLGVFSGLLLGWIGTSYYSGEVEVYYGSSIATLSISPIYWQILSLMLMIFIIGIGYKIDPKFGWTVFSVIAGGCIMVLGYFLYQQFFLGPLFNIEVIAFAEIPVNIGQMIVGATVALPLSQIIKRTLPSIFQK